jgi:hypothetical protein
MPWAGAEQHRRPRSDTLIIYKNRRIYKRLRSGNLEKNGGNYGIVYYVPLVFFAFFVEQTSYSTKLHDFCAF